MNEQQFLLALAEHEGILHKICRLYRDRPEDREDLFQEIVFQLWKSLPSYAARSKFSTWLYKVALSTAMVHYRSKQVTVVYLPALPEVAADSPEHQLADMLALLNPAEKALMALWLEELPYAEIAEITGLSENNVGVKLNRIRNKLKTQVKSSTWKN